MRVVVRTVSEKMRVKLPNTEPCPGMQLRTGKVLGRLQGEVRLGLPEATRPTVERQKRKRMRAKEVR